MDQTGDPRHRHGGPGYTIPDENPPKAANTASSTRSGRSPWPTRVAQHGRQPVVHRRRAEGESLPNTYALFGQVTSGMNVVDTINQQGSAAGVPPDVTQRILSITIASRRRATMATPTPPAADGSSPQQRKFDEEPPTIIDTDKRYVATMATSHGTMVIALDPLAAPKAVNSFVFLARYHYYDGIVFHRIIPGFVLQGGDPTGNGLGRSRLPLRRRAARRPAATGRVVGHGQRRARTPTAASSSSSAATTACVFRRSTRTSARWSAATT